MQCKKCGMTIAEGSRFCNHCGTMTEISGETPAPAERAVAFVDVCPGSLRTKTNSNTNGLAIAGFSCAIIPLFTPLFLLMLPPWFLFIGTLVCLTGFVLSILGASHSKFLPNRSGHGLAVAGIVISSIQIAFAILSVILIAWLLAGIGSLIGNSLWGVGKLIESFINGYTDAIKTFSDVFNAFSSSIP